MVSTSKILGKSSLIFVTVGTTPFSFMRLFAAIDHTLSKINMNYQLIVQQGPTEYQWQYKNKVIYRTLSPIELDDNIIKADKIITHAGIGSLILIHQKAKINPLVIARLKAMREHVDDHQKNFVEYLRKQANKKIRDYFVVERNIESPIQSYLQSTTQAYFPSHILVPSNKQLLISRLKKFIDK